ncbi:hypothetical protein Ddye_028373 [Dipteronia dyeriana]|uniref:Uncharacterized protein n=1 Tax=Dipteronia dyeriana TaxID=168575 RepID=A0AAD9WS94_9ROSI|nr:hypothetical protein Ddye_028373 [Dipteronia dyeriana]
MNFYTCNILRNIFHIFWHWRVDCSIRGKDSTRDQRSNVKRNTGLDEPTNSREKANLTELARHSYKAELHLYKSPIGL